MFSLIGLGEKAGSGIDKIREGWKSVRWRVPTLSESRKPDRVTVTMPMVSLLPETAVNDLRQILGDELDSITADEVQALVAADMEGCFSNFRLPSLTERHPADLTKLLKALVGRDLLERDAHSRGATITEDPDMSAVVMSVKSVETQYDDYRLDRDAEEKLLDRFRDPTDPLFELGESPRATDVVDAVLVGVARPVRGWLELARGRSTGVRCVASELVMDRVH